MNWDGLEAALLADLDLLEAPAVASLPALAFLLALERPFLLEPEPELDPAYFREAKKHCFKISLPLSKCRKRPMCHKYKLSQNV